MASNIQATTWRKSVIQSGLLLEKPADASSTSQPARHCGVSLHYLVGFMNSIKGCIKDSKEVRGLRSESTAAAMHRYVFPCRFGRWMDYFCFLIDRNMHDDVKIKSRCRVSFYITINVQFSPLTQALGLHPIRAHRYTTVVRGPCMVGQFPGHGGLPRGSDGRMGR